MTQNNLGNALWTLGKREEDKAKLHEAHAAIAAAWQVHHEAGLVHYHAYYKGRLTEIEALIASRAA